MLSYVNLVHHDECRETGDIRSEAKYDDMLGGKSCYARNMQVRAIVCKLRSVEHRRI
jgi:hypothetical protein